MFNLKTILKVLGISLFCTGLRMVAGAVFSTQGGVKGGPSLLANKVGEIPVAATMIFICYLSLSIVFVMFQDRLPGSKFVKGLGYGLAFGLLWAFGMLEAPICENTSLIHEIIVGLSETICITPLGILLGIICGTDSKDKFRIVISKRGIMTVMTIALLFFAGRYIPINIRPYYLTKLFATFFWTLGNGIMIGLVYLFIRDMIKNYSPLKAAIIFSFCIFGIDWFVYSLFVPALIATPVSKLLNTFITKAVIDILFVFFGVLLAESKVYTKKPNE